MHAVARAIQRMKVVDAINLLSLQNSNAAREYVKLLKNAYLNFPYSDVSKLEDLVILEIKNGVGSRRLKSYRPKSRGRGYEVRRRGKSNTTLTVGLLTEN